MAEKQLKGSGKASIIPSIIPSVRKEIPESTFNSYELYCVRAKPTQSTTKHIVIGGVRFPICNKKK